MDKTIEQVEKNVSASFGYVKKDMLMLNDAFSDLHDKVQKLNVEFSKIIDELSALKTPAKTTKKASPKKKTTKKKPAKKNVKKVVKETTVYS